MIWKVWTNGIFSIDKASLIEAKTLDEAAKIFQQKFKKQAVGFQPCKNIIRGFQNEA